MMMNDSETKDTIRKIWDYSSISYDSNAGHGIFSEEEKNAWTRELRLNLPPGPLKILDVGCGTGAMALLFAGMGHQVTGIDLSREMLTKAGKKADEKSLTLELGTGDAEYLPFPDGSFDVVVNRHLLWTLPHPETALKDWHRVLKPGGRVFIIDGVWDDNSLLSWMKIRMSSGVARIFEPHNTHQRSYDPTIRASLPYAGGVPEEITLNLLKDTGFVHLDTRNLMYIRELQKTDLPWYKRLAQGKSYYIIISVKNGM
ncbi:MAG: methyltransferase domain-containing protein [Methanospirillum sp.]|uniref:class I SAM-dependent methyltransferase n=1 Tax=Methanospirillum sp. TaxID=45200 RepID=UPI002369F776|nr:class I SAM-dependent methyltransferase [Methanospirillum sp.]MDD1729622.1 methyltransferase domain-containing protein [Methanospirillum sp.]